MTLSQIIAQGFHKTVSGASPITVSEAKDRAFEHNILTGNTVRTITIDGVEYVVPDGYTLLDNEGSTATAYYCKRNSDNATGTINLTTGIFTASSFTPGSVLPNPEQPLGVKSCGDKTENLFNKDNPSIINNFMIHIATVSVNTDNHGFSLKLTEGETYTVSKSNSGRLYVGASAYPFVLGTNDHLPLLAQKASASAATFTVPLGKPYIDIVYWHKNNDAGYTESDVRNTLTLVEGTTAPTSYIPYGYKVTERVSGVNLFNPDNADTRYNGWWSNGGVVANLPGTNRTIITPCSEGDVFTFKHYTEASGARYFWIYSDTVAVGEPCSSAYGDVIGTGPKTTTAAPSNAKYIGICFWRINGGTVQSAADDFVIVKGSSAPTHYEPYFAPTEHTAYIDKPLDKVGTYADTFDMATGEHTEDTEIIVLDGVTAGHKVIDVATAMVSSKHYYGFYGIKSSTAYKNFVGFISNYFKTSAANSWPSANANEIVAQGAQSSASVFLTIADDDTERNTVEKLNAWFAARLAAGNPVWIGVPLATPTTSQHSPVAVIPAKGTNYVESTNEVKASNIAVSGRVNVI